MNALAIRSPLLVEVLMVNVLPAKALPSTCLENCPPSALKLTCPIPVSNATFAPPKPFGSGGVLEAVNVTPKFNKFASVLNLVIAVLKVVAHTPPVAVLPGKIES